MPQLGQEIHDIRHEVRPFYRRITSYIGRPRWMDKRMGINGDQAHLPRQPLNA